MIQPVLPLWDKVIFVDWHGVLSRDPFWMSILNRRQHPLHQQLSESVEKLFSQNDALICDWMRGNVNASQVIDSMEIVLNKSYNSDYLVRKLVEDCRLMRTNTAFINILRKVQNNGAFIVLATDNMDCFFEQMQRSKNRRRSYRKSIDLSKNQTLPMAETVNLFDDVLCSSELGVLKREDPTRFFGNWLDKQSLDFTNALLLDDLKDNCSTFRAAGGTAITVTTESFENGSNIIQSKICNWLQITS
ncbi:hypothetical protein [uncultured Gimesia sp.]|uniref:hypothetical protein n=1 Tax=uncultured Gimesia sp. TaxID=1678688 RepID=UPI002633C7DE|nr:hypothetical protein [uncultured Gimesia sp.]